MARADETCHTDYVPARGAHDQPQNRMTLMIPNQRYRCIKAIEPLRVGDTFTYLDSVPYLDWYQCLILLEDGRKVGIGYGLPNYCEAIS